MGLHALHNEDDGPAEAPSELVRLLHVRVVAESLVEIDLGSTSVALEGETGGTTMGAQAVWGSSKVWVEVITRCWRSRLRRRWTAAGDSATADPISSRVARASSWTMAKMVRSVPSISIAIPARLLTGRSETAVSVFSDLSRMVQR
ncbi:MAG: hypothetical protein MAG471_01361 [Acidimicrobiaceae bacterium]|nr:hypothetical protein [Acidimicrobiaceae bacterium]